MTKHIVIDARGRQSSSGRYIDRLVEHLQNLDTEHDYTVLLKPGDPWQPRANNFRAQTCRFKQFSFNPLDQITFARHLQSLKPDLVHFWMTPQEPMFYGGKRVTTTHDLTMLRFTRPGRLPGWLHSLRMVGYRWLMRGSLRRADRILAPTQFVAKDVATHYPFTTGKITVTLEASEPPLDIEPEALAGVHKPFILYVGSAFPHKNLERLIEAHEILVTKYPDLQLVLAGKKERYYYELERKARASKAADNILIPGFVSDAQLKWLYQNAEAYVFPSLSEGFGLPPLEAMAHGCPVVSSDATCLPEVSGDAALYFDPGNPEDMADKVSMVLDHKTVANELRAKGKQLLTRYSWEKMARETLAVYQEVLED